LLAAGGLGGKTVVEKIAESGQVTPVLTIPNSLALSFDPSGTRLLYLVGHKRPTLAEATIADGKLIPAPWRDPLNLGALAW
jgi:hypothetical protein